MHVPAPGAGRCARRPPAPSRIALFVSLAGAFGPGPGVASGPAASAAPVPPSPASQPASQPDDAPPLAGNAFWALNVGWWRSENTYFDGALNYNIRSYASLQHIEIVGGLLRQTEYKFYAPGRLALAAGRGLARPDEGVEVDTVTLAEPIDASGTVRLTRVSPRGPPGETTITVLTPDTAVSVTRQAMGAADDYRMFITLPTADKRYAANFGIIDGAGTDPDPAHAGSVGDLRGFSLFRQTRFAADELARLRRELRQRFNVHALVSAANDDSPRVERLP